MNSKSTLKIVPSLCFLFSLLLMSGSGFGQPWTYDFGTGTGSWTTGISTTFLPTPPSGTARVRVGTGSGSFNLENPGLASLGTATELRSVAPTATSVNKVSVYDYTAGKTGYLKFSLLLGNSTGGNTATSGVWYLFLGDGAIYSDNNTFSGTQVFTGISWTFGGSGAITTAYRNGGAWTTIGGTPFSQGNVYLVEIYFNNTTTSQNYARGTAQSLATNTFDLWVNGTLIGDDFSKAQLPGDANIDSWLFYGASSTSNVANLFLDDMEYSNALPTGGTAPAVTTQAVSGIGVTSATGNGEITNTGGANATARGFCYDLYANPDPDLSDAHTTESGSFGTGAFTGAISSLSAETRYKVVAYATNPTGTGYGSAVNFWTLSAEPSAHSTTFSNTVVSQTQIDLSFDAASTISNADGYIILQKAGSAPTGLPSDGNAYSVGNTLGDATVAAIVTNSSATAASATGLNAATHYYFTLIPFNWNGTDGVTYNYKTDGTIPGTDGTTLASLDATSEVSGPVLGSQPNPGTISSLITTDPAAVRVFDMDIYDYGTDGYPTQITQVTIKAGTNNTADWASTIQGVKLSTDGGTTFVTTGTPVIAVSSIVIPVTSGNLNIPDADALTLSLYIYLKGSGLTDNAIFEFKVDAAASSHGWIADATGSTFLSTFSSAPVSNQITLTVTATEMRFVQQPSNTLINQVMSPAVSVEATDANGNRDLDVAGSSTITSSGTMTGPVTATLASGFGTAGDIVHTATGTSLTLTATFGSLTNGTSSTFDILPALTVGDILFIGYGTDDPDKFAFLVVNALPDGTQIYFTDNAWTGSALATNEGTIRWNSPSGGVTAGNAVTVNPASLTASLGTVNAVSGSMALALGGDQVLAYQGTSASPAFVSGVSSTGWITSGSTTSNTSYLPSPLAIYSSAIGFASELDNGYYSGPMTLANGATGALVCNAANWTRSDAIQTFPSWSFSLGTATIIDVTATAQDLTIGASETCTVNSGKGFTVNGTLANNAGADGLVVKAGGSLIETTSNVDAKVEIYLTECVSGSPDNFKCWHYVSSPVVDARAGVFAGDYLRHYDEPGDQWSPYYTHTGTLLNETQGYAVSAPTSGTRTFSGKLNTGNLTTTPALTLTGSKSYGFNLVGNPYPSRIDLNSSGIVWTNVVPKVYFLDKATGNYVVWPAGTPYGTGTRYPEPGQGFFVYIETPNTSGTIQFTDAARTHTTDANSQFYKDEVPDLLSLKVQSFNGSGDKLLVCFRPDASSGWDENYDCFKLFGDRESPQMYTVTPGSSKLTVNSLPYDGVNTVVPVGFSVTESGTGSYTITAENLGSFASGTTITIEDKKESMTQNLMENPSYTFSYVTGEEPDRFLLHFFNPAYGIDDKSPDSRMHIYSFGNELYVKDIKGASLEGELVVYNMVGQEIARKSIATSESMTTFTLNVRTGHYLVKLITGDSVYSGKVFLTE